MLLYIVVDPAIQSSVSRSVSVFEVLSCNCREITRKPLSWQKLSIIVDLFKFFRRSLKDLEFVRCCCLAEDC